MSCPLNKGRGGLMAKRDKLEQAIHETQEHLRLNGSPDADEEDALDRLMDECGHTREGFCMLAGTEHCDFTCPFRDELEL